MFNQTSIEYLPYSGKTEVSNPNIPGTFEMFLGL